MRHLIYFLLLISSFSFAGEINPDTDCDGHASTSICQIWTSPWMSCSDAPTHPNCKNKLGSADFYCEVLESNGDSEHLSVEKVISCGTPSGGSSGGDSSSSSGGDSSSSSGGDSSSSSGGDSSSSSGGDTSSSSGGDTSSSSGGDTGSSSGGDTGSSSGGDTGSSSGGDTGSSSGGGSGSSGGDSGGTDVGASSSSGSDSSSSGSSSGTDTSSSSGGDGSSGGVHDSSGGSGGDTGGGSVGSCPLAGEVYDPVLNDCVAKTLCDASNNFCNGAGCPADNPDCAGDGGSSSGGDTGSSSGGDTGSSSGGDTGSSSGGDTGSSSGGDTGSSSGGDTGGSSGGGDSSGNEPLDCQSKGLIEHPSGSFCIPDTNVTCPSGQVKDAFGWCVDPNCPNGDCPDQSDGDSLLSQLLQVEKTRQAEDRQDTQALHLDLVDITEAVEGIKDEEIKQAIDNIKDDEIISEISDIKDDEIISELSDVENAVKSLEQTLKDKEIGGGGSGDTPQDPDEQQGECNPEDKDYLACIDGYSIAQPTAPYSSDEIQSMNDSIDALKLQLDEELKNARETLADLISLNTKEGNPFYSDKREIMGVDVEFGTVVFEDAIRFLPSLIILMATFYSALIIFGARS